MNRTWIALGLAFTLASCAPVLVNPQRKSCTDACAQAKNRCLLAAGTPAAVEQCDAEHQACAEPCLAMPKALRAAQ